jgi:transposase
MKSREHPVHQDLSGHVYTMEENREVKPARRRRHSEAFKAEAVKACMQQGVSIAAVALHYRLNANLLRRWVVAHETQEPDTVTPASRLMPIQPAEFVPLQLNLANTAAGTQDIVIEIRRGAAMVAVRWPASAAAECATWLQGWLR